MYVQCIYHISLVPSVF